MVTVTKINQTSITVYREGKFKTGPIELYIKVYVGNIGEWANSRWGESISDPHREKIRLGDFKAVYSLCANEIFMEVYSDQI